MNTVLLSRISASLQDDAGWRSWRHRIAGQMAEICNAIGAPGCGWVSEFPTLPEESFANAPGDSLRVVRVAGNRVLLAYNMDLPVGTLSSAEMTEILAYQRTAWTPNLQNWPVTAWKKRGGDTPSDAQQVTVCIPLHGPQGTASLVFVPLMSATDSWYEPALKLVGQLLAAEKDIRSLLGVEADPGVPLLSPRELQSLSWAARGKTAWESARIQGISERAVIHRLRRAREKLGVASTALAISRAAKLGLVETV